MASEHGRHVPGTPYTYRHGWKPLPEIRLSDLTSGDGRRSPAVSSDEFQEYAKRGAEKYATLKAGAKPPYALINKARWTQITNRAYAESRKPWGGMTVDTHLGTTVDSNADKYALTIRKPGTPSVTVDPAADADKFRAAMDDAKERFSEELSWPGAHLGIFHDQDTGQIDIDPVLVTDSLEDVHDIGAYTHAVGGAYHFKSGNGYWPPHVKEEGLSLSYITPRVHNASVDLAHEGGRLAFWKQILPKRSIHYTAKDGSRQVLNLTEDYLTDLANNRAVDSIGFLLADKDNAHTMDPERWRGKVVQMEVRDDGLYGKIVFPSVDAAKAVLDNPELGVSARIRENIPRADGSTVSRGIIHVLGTLDPQADGMTPWQPTDLSQESGDVLDLSDKEYDDMKKSLADYTEADIEKMTDKELDEYLAAVIPDLDDAMLERLAGEVSEDDDEPKDDDDGDEPKDDDEPKTTPELAGASLSKTSESTEIDLANQRAAEADARAREALRRVADAEWRELRASYLAEGVPPFALDLAAPVLNRPSDMVIDLSNSDEDDVNVSDVTRGLLDALKGTIDLSDEVGHSGTYNGTDDPDADMLARWAAESDL